ncbi:MAG: dTMP kinase [Bacteroidales bacterium]|nr:dTMP kinase [Bacteroidales bacterium]
MLIVLEGLDGAGKSTQVKMISGHLAQTGKKTKFLHFPRFDAPVYGELIAKFLRGDFGDNNQVHPQLVALLYAEDRHDAAGMIRQWLDEGYYVILDRYVYSNIAFQCAKMNSKEEASQLRDWIFDLEYNHYGIPKPDLNLLLDVPIEFIDNNLKNARNGEDRKYLQGRKDIHEANLDFQVKVRNVYLEQCLLDETFKRIDCAGKDGKMLPAEDIFDKIKELL